MKKISVLILFLILFFPNVSFTQTVENFPAMSEPFPSTAGLTYYLDSQNGNDTTGDGSSGKPYKTIAFVWPKLKGGDTVILNNGTYDELYSRSLTDYFSDWVTFKAANGANPSIQKVTFGLNGGQFSLGLYSAKVKIEGVKILDGVSIVGARDIVIKNSIIERIGPWSGNDADVEKTALSILRGKDILILNNDITNTGIGIAMGGDNIHVINNHIHDITHDGIRVVGAKNSLIEGNKIHGLDDGVTDAQASWSKHCDGIHIFIAGAPTESNIIPNSNIMLRGNIIYDIEAQGVQFNNYYKFPNIKNNKIYFENNIFGPTAANAFNLADPVDTLVFRNNSFVQVPGRIYKSRFRDIPMTNTTLRISDPTTNVSIYNNILSAPFSKTSNQIINDFNLIQASSCCGGKAISRGTLISSNVQFQNPAAFDGVLVSNSPAIDAGTKLFAPDKVYSKDIKGTNRDARIDIGAYEVPGRSPSSETGYPPKHSGTATTYIDDFEDANFDLDPYLEGVSTQGLSWSQPSSNNGNFTLRQDTYLNRNYLSSPIEIGTGIITAKEGIVWKDYTFDFDAYNQYFIQNGGPIFLVKDDKNYYWLDIGRDAGNLVRVVNGVSTNLANAAILKLPHLGLKNYRIKVEHITDGVKIDVDVNRDGTVDFTYTDKDIQAKNIFTNGSIGFRRTYASANIRIAYDNIKVFIAAVSNNVSFPPVAVTPPSTPTVIPVVTPPSNQSSQVENTPVNNTVTNNTVTTGGGSTGGSRGGGGGSGGGSSSISSTGNQQATIESLIALIAQLQSQINAILLARGQTPAYSTTNNGINSSINITSGNTTSTYYRNLSQGMSGNDVKSLQTYLNSKGYTVSATGYFGPLTKIALMKFQVDQGVSPASGLFGPITRSKIK